MSEHSSRREQRRRRRMITQLVAYGAVAVVLLLIGLGVTLLIKYFKNAGNSAPSPAAQVETETSSQESSSDEYVLYINEEETSEAETETETETEEETTVDLLEEVVRDCIDDMPIEDKVAGLFIITPEQLTGVDTVLQAGDGTKEALDKYHIGGLIYFDKNIKSEEQLTEMITNTKAFSKYPLFIAVDEELGDVARLRKGLNLDPIQSAADIGAANDASKAYEAYNSIGKYMIKYGFNLDFAPVSDVLLNADNKAIGNRSFGSDEAIVSSMVDSSVRGLKDAGVTACLKHFPGQGAVNSDTHEGVALLDRSEAEIDSVELKPFLAGIEAGADMIMVGHMTVPQITQDNVLPASLSKEIITDLLREKYQYEGVVITDALNMAAVSDYYSADEAAIKALKAGADMILMPEDFVLAYEGVLKAVDEGVISEQRINDSLARVYRIKYRATVE
ncbi:MAG: glycoside hydrolase family 3 protein [Lachnospiraceae bacterium]|nr:glycoside hydrolase family 3 protein [Lachnospiraceae bacterium]